MGDPFLNPGPQATKHGRECLPRQDPGIACVQNEALSSRYTTSLLENAPNLEVSDPSIRA